jgi:hypothetical protein
MPGIPKTKTLPVPIKPLRVQQDRWHAHEGPAQGHLVHRHARQEPENHSRGRMPLPAGTSRRDVVGAGVEALDARHDPAGAKARLLCRHLPSP